MRQLTISQSITHRDVASLNKYLSDISKLDMVTASEEESLAQRIRQGDQQALDILTKANLRFVVSVAKQYQFQGVTLSDMINEGNIGLIKAAKRYDETKGFKFISYAVWWIRQAILQAILEQGRMVRLPINKTSLSLRIQKAISILEQELERTPSIDELAAYLEVDVKEVTMTMEAGPYHASLDAPMINGEEGTLLDKIQTTMAATDMSVVHYQSLEIELKRSMTALSKVEKEIVCYFYGIGFANSSSLLEISLKYDLTKERVRQIRDKALLKIRRSRKADLLRTYL